MAVAVLADVADLSRSSIPECISLAGSNRRRLPVEKMMAVQQLLVGLAVAADLVMFP